MPQPQIPPNATATATLQVKQSDLASTLPLEQGDAYPAVFATSRMIALMEIAAARIIAPYLSEGQLSVGVDVNATHSAPTPVGAMVSARARFTGMKGKLFGFEVTAWDDAGEIGRAVHTRGIVEQERLERSARGRAKL